MSASRMPTERPAAESAMREVIGQTPIQSALTEGRNEIEESTQARVQQLLDDYGAGIEVRRVQLLKVDPPGPVIDAFVDVQRAVVHAQRLANGILNFGPGLALIHQRERGVRLVAEHDRYIVEAYGRSGHVRSTRSIRSSMMATTTMMNPLSNPRAVFT